MNNTNNVIMMKSQSDWFVMNMVKQYIKELKQLPATEENIAAIARNEAALRSFFEEIKVRSTSGEGSIPKAA